VHTSIKLFCFQNNFKLFWIFDRNYRGLRRNTGLVISLQAKLLVIPLYTIIIIIIIFIIIIVIIISFMQGIYTYIPETNYVSREYSVAVILLLLFMVLISLVSVLNLLYF